MRLTAGCFGRLNMTDFGAPTPEAKTNSECSYKRNVLIRSERSQGERRDKRRARRFVQVSKCVLFFALANEWHNECTILIYASAACLPRERRITLYRKHSIRVVEEIPARTGKMGHFYLGFYTQNFCSAVNLLKLIRALCIFVTHIIYFVHYPERDIEMKNKETPIRNKTQRTSST